MINVAGSRSCQLLVINVVVQVTGGQAQIKLVCCLLNMFFRKCLYLIICEGRASTLTHHFTLTLDCFCIFSNNSTRMRRFLSSSSLYINLRIITSSSVIHFISISLADTLSGLEPASVHGDKGPNGEKDRMCQIKHTTINFELVEKRLNLML